MTPRPRTRRDQKAATRARLLRVGRRLFTERGFDATSIGAICRAARVTHGALYHHFPGKTELFASVLEEVMGEVAQRVQAAVAEQKGWAQVEAGCREYLDACSDAAVHAIVFRDGPRVLPRGAFDDIDHQTNEPFVGRLLQGWIDEGLLAPFSVELGARVLGGAFAEAGAVVAASPDPDQARRAAGDLILKWMGALRPGGPSRS